jgi:hypothetical protein
MIRSRFLNASSKPAFTASFTSTEGPNASFRLLPSAARESGDQFGPSPALRISTLDSNRSFQMLSAVKIPITDRPNTGGPFAVSAHWNDTPRMRVAALQQPVMHASPVTRPPRPSSFRNLAPAPTITGSKSPRPTGSRRQSPSPTQSRIHGKSPSPPGMQARAAARVRLGVPPEAHMRLQSRLLALFRAQSRSRVAVGPR